LRYHVEHPVWETYSVHDYSIDVDWEALYGPEWAFLTKATPESVILAAGSPVSVYGHHRLLPKPPSPVDTIHSSESNRGSPLHG
jgi:hypothetical protein